MLCIGLQMKQRREGVIITSVIVVCLCGRLANAKIQKTTVVFCGNCPHRSGSPWLSPIGGQDNQIVIVNTTVGRRVSTLTLSLTTNGMTYHVSENTAFSVSITSEVDRHLQPLTLLFESMANRTWTMKLWNYWNYETFWNCVQWT